MSRGGIRVATDPFAKLPIVKAHLESSVRMIAAEVHPFTLHLPVRAAGEIIRAMCIKTGTPHAFNLEGLMTKEKRELFRARRVEAYNYLKHFGSGPVGAANRLDVDKIAMLNIFELVFSCFDYWALSGTQSEFPLRGFVNLAGVLYPELLDWEAAIASQPGLAAVRQEMASLTLASLPNALRLTFQTNGGWPVPNIDALLTPRTD